LIDSCCNVTSSASLSSTTHLVHFILYPGITKRPG
jgi:hypothetical protein